MCLNSTFNLIVGAIAPQSLESLMQTILECLRSTDWATCKALADALTALALHSSNLVADGATSTLTVLEAYRFDKVAFRSRFSSAWISQFCFFKI
ncbi:hypothetical protein Dsin_021709 [Dipteronia sinensis]|uniref:TORTIFOLIA1/SINE1-2 N-terminal domain-containing protein n=1 Tax=Dipteronia sinensis TaxID=43782 RepID=A0AAE0DZC7_9ROSI|nr:hypothetical protein Dsin_021709 [Dipteronia sinensis]